MGRSDPQRQSGADGCPQENLSRTVWRPVGYLSTPAEFCLKGGGGSKGGWVGGAVRGDPPPPQETLSC